MTETISRDPKPEPAEAVPTSAGNDASEADTSAGQREVGGRKGPEPTRYGDWEKNGRCIDF